MSKEAIVVATDPRGVATVTLNRPALRNAFDDALIATLLAALRRLAADNAVRAVVLTGAGKAFSAGADLNWMRRMAGYGYAENRADALQLATMLRTLDELPKPTVARVNGAAYAGGVGLVACCDLAVACESAVFCISEARLGLVPGTISPYVVAAIGPRAARRYFLTAETFSAAVAHRIGLVHEVAADDRLDDAVEKVLGDLLQGGVVAQGRSKRLVAEVAGRPLTEPLMHFTADAIAEARASAEGREGLAAFFEKRKPAWRG
jgi:methylglutaconyl-CoA hydratase